MESEGRRRPRYPFIAVAQVTESQSGAVLEARTSDLGDNGCYVDTINPLPQGTVISIQITHQDQVFVARGLVARPSEHGDGRHIHRPRIRLRNLARNLAARSSWRKFILEL